MVHLPPWQTGGAFLRRGPAQIVVIPGLSPCWCSACANVRRLLFANFANRVTVCECARVCVFQKRALIRQYTLLLPVFPKDTSRACVCVCFCHVCSNEENSAFHPCGRSTNRPRWYVAGGGEIFLSISLCHCHHHPHHRSSWFNCLSLAKNWLGKKALLPKKETWQRKRR